MKNKNSNIQEELNNLDTEGQKLKKALNKINILLEEELKKATVLEKIHYHCLCFKHEIIMTSIRIKRELKNYSFS